MNDIAAALTGSMPTDGSAAFTGPVNFNGQSVSGINNLTVNGTLTAGYISTAGNINAGGAFTGGAFIGASVAVSGLIYTNGSRIISEGANNNPSITCWDIGQNAAAGMFLGPGSTLYLAAMDGGGNYIGDWYAFFDTAGDLSVRGSIAALGNITASGSLFSNNNISAAGDVIINGQGIRYNGFAPYNNIIALGWNGNNVAIWVDGVLEGIVPGTTAVAALEAHVDALETEIAALREELHHVPA